MCGLSTIVHKVYMYAKIFASMFKGTMYGNPDGIITFMLMLVLSDQEGIVDMTPEALSAQTSIPLEIIQRGIDYLCRPDPNSRTEAEEGRRINLLDNHRNWGWYIVNYAKYRNMRNAEERREYFRTWKRTKRAQQKSTASTSCPQMSTGVHNVHLSDAEAFSYSEARKKEEREARAARSAPARRLPSDFELTPERRAIAEAEKLDPEREFASFRDYWSAASGAKARKHDWEATWRNWCRKAADFKPRGNGAGRATYRPPKPVSQLEDEAIARGIGEGKSDLEIANEIDVDIQRVRNFREASNAQH